MNLLRLNAWRKGIALVFIVAVVAMFTVDMGYHFNVGHVVRLGVGAFVFWILVDRF